MIVIQYNYTNTYNAKNICCKKMIRQQKCLNITYQYSIKPSYQKICILTRGAHKHKTTTSHKKFIEKPRHAHHEKQNDIFTTKK